MALFTFLLITSSITSVVASVPVEGVPANSSIYCGPKDGQSNDEWWTDMLKFREGILGNRTFCDATNLFGQNPWVSSMFVAPQVQIQDNFLYDHIAHNWTVDRYLDDLDARYGGIDGVLLWHSYTNLGADPRNQMELLATVPGGLAGLKQVVKQFHERGVRVLFPWNPWDRNGSFSGHEEPDNDFADLLVSLGADGFNLDSGGRGGVPGTPGYNPAARAYHGTDGSEFVQYAMQKHQTALLDQPEHGSGCPPWGPAPDNFAPVLGGWVGEGGGPTHCPGVAVFPVECVKFVEPRHTSQFTGRFDTHRQSALRYSFVNGIGYNTWENVWGMWNGISPKDAETLRRMYRIMRFFHNNTKGCDWRPFYPGLQNSTKAQASMFPDRGPIWARGPTSVLWNVVAAYDVPLLQFNLSVNLSGSGWRFFDVWQGKELQTVVTGTEVILELNQQSDALASVAAVQPLVADSPLFQRLLSQMRATAQRSLYNYSDTPGLTTNNTFTVYSPATRSVASRQNSTDGVRVPSTQSYRFSSETLAFEKYMLPIYPDFAHVNCSAVVGSVPGSGCVSQAPMSIASFTIDKYPVTNGEYGKFLKQSRYTPAGGSMNFLTHWDQKADANGNTTYTFWTNITHKPVVYVSLEDARAYCDHQGKRLPNEWEWQYAAQGLDGRMWPWGNDTKRTKGPCMPDPYVGREQDVPLADVNAFDNNSCGGPNGVEMLVGSVWQWTNSIGSLHTRVGLLKGGSVYWRTDDTRKYPALKERSLYYFPNCARPTWNDGHSHVVNVNALECHGQYLLMDGSYERASTIGFRCVQDHGSSYSHPDLGVPSEDLHIVV